MTAVTGALARHPEARPVARTESGEVAGVVRATRFGPAISWRAIPYAAPPTGQLRFAAPRPPLAWDGVRPATVRGPQAPQPNPLLPPQLAPIFGSRGANHEDCLTLDVHVPAAAGPHAPGAAPSVAADLDGPHPVLVWIHGGGFETGTAGDFDGALLAARGRIVVVAINYRLGMLGFGNMLDVVGERDGIGAPHERVATNVGLRDQIRALEWVRDNIGGMGGDPDRVTIAGESAGACSVSLLMQITAARGLFHQAIAQSGSANMATDRDDAARLAREFCAQVGASREDPSSLWTAPIAEVLRAELVVSQARPSAITCRPWLDGDLLPDDYAGLARAGDEPSAVAFLSGHNREEHTFFRRFARGQFPTTRAAIAVALDDAVGPVRAAELLALYPDDDAGLTALGTDLAFTMPGIQHSDRQARSANVWRYRLDYRSPAFGLGAFHGLDVLLLWPQRSLTRLLVLGRDPSGPELADRMQRHWAHFVAHGTPDPDLAPDWTAYDPRNRTTMLFGADDVVASDPERGRREVWGEQEFFIY
ncbi:carboxylesterase/lipase family protein [Beutenbergia cavernae]|uniref:carboxylesterase/lipase family protein n=1 Tax=Beutenbergia cavernae TaxID=84757 RepID=UPI0002D712F6|nr:carboxylesterase family protein [Beutenbergia cavernae]